MSDNDDKMNRNIMAKILIICVIYLGCMGVIFAHSTVEVEWSIGHQPNELQLDVVHQHVGLSDDTQSLFQNLHKHLSNSTTHSKSTHDCKSSHASTVITDPSGSDLPDMPDEFVEVQASVLWFDNLMPHIGSWQACQSEPLDTPLIKYPDILTTFDRLLE